LRGKYFPLNFEVGTLFPQYSSKGLLGIPKEASFWRADELALHQSIAQPKSGGRAAEKLEVIPKLWRGRLPWDTQRALKIESLMKSVPIPASISLTFSPTEAS